MVELSFELKLDEIVPFEKSVFCRDNVYLWIWHADKIPPHIGISSNGFYYSLKSNGKDNGVEIEHVIELVERKAIKTLLFELNSETTKTDISEVFNRYDCTVPNQVTCLNPIKKVLGIEEAGILKDLLVELEINNTIQKVIGFNIDGSFEGLKDYDVNAIHDRLRKLKNA